MLQNVFRLIPSKTFDTIFIEGIPTYIEVFNLRYYNYVEGEDDIVWYATGDDPLAFLVYDIVDQAASFLDLAFKWYGIQKNYGEMDISLFDPRRSQYTLRKMSENKFLLN